MTVIDQEGLDANVTAVRLVQSALSGDGTEWTLTGPAGMRVVSGLCALVINVLTELGRARALLTDEQREALARGEGGSSPGYVRQMLDDIHVALLLDQLGPPELSPGDST